MGSTTKRLEQLKQSIIFPSKSYANRKVKTLRMKIYPTKEQRIFLDKLIDTSRYVYNKILIKVTK